MLNRRQIYEWIAYAKMFPFGEEREDFRYALQTFFIRAPWVGEEADEKPEDFMPNFDNKPLKTDAQLILDEIKDLL